MLAVPIYNESGQKIGDEQIDEALLGGEVNIALLKQAAVMYHANLRQGHAVNKSRGMVEGSTRKLYKQKGTGRARRGPVRSPIMKGGGRAFAKKVREFRHDMPKKMRRLARDNAVLAKIKTDQALIVDQVRFDEPKTARFAKLLRSIKCEAGCVFATLGADTALFKSGRNIPKAQVLDVAELNAHQILTHRVLIFTRDAFTQFRDAATKAGRKGA